MKGVIKVTKNSLFSFFILYYFARIKRNINSFKAGEKMVRKTNVLIMIILVLSVILSACGQKEIPNALNYQVRDFKFTDQDGKSFGLADLKGKIWVSDFIFTSCADVCLPMTKNMADLQAKLKDKGIKDVELVSFSVDPAMDTPENLKFFAKNFGVDFNNWHFLTGYSQEDIETFAYEDYKAIVKKPEDEDQVIHGTSFYLINQDGKIVKLYDGLDQASFDEIINDIKILQQ